MGTDDDFSFWEKDRFYKLSLIPTFVVLSVILIYFYYLMSTNPMENYWDFIIHVGWLFLFLPITLFTAFEVLYYRRVRKPIEFHLKRLFGQIILVTLSFLSLLGFLFLFEQIIPPITSYWEGFLLGIVLWMLIFFLLVIKFREKLSKFEIHTSLCYNPLRMK